MRSWQASCWDSAAPDRHRCPRGGPEISRVLRPGGVLLICEETDPEHRDGAVEDDTGMGTIGRTIGQDEALFSEFTLLQTNPWRIEPTYPRPDVGTYMLFAERTPARGRLVGGK